MGYLLVLFITSLILSTNAEQCQSTPFCHCWQLGDVRMVIDCSNQGLSKMPSFATVVKLQTTRLFLTNNMLTFVAPETFSEEKWPLLQYLNIKGNPLLNCYKLQTGLSWINVICDSQQMTTDIQVKYTN